MLKGKIFLDIHLERPSQEQHKQGGVILPSNAPGNAVPWAIFRA